MMYLWLESDLWKGKAGSETVGPSKCRPKRTHNMRSCLFRDVTLIFFNWSWCANYFISLIIVNKLLSDTSTVLHFVMTSIAQGRWGKLKSIYVWIMQGQIKNLLTGSTCCTLCIRNKSTNAAYSAKNNREGIINHKQKTF